MFHMESGFSPQSSKRTVVALEPSRLLHQNHMGKCLSQGQRMGSGSLRAPLRLEILYTFLRSNNDYNGDYREARLVWKVATGLEESSWHALWREKASALPSRPHSYGQSGEQCTVIPSCFLTAAFEKLHQSRQFSEGNRRSHKHRRPTKVH